MFEGFRTIILTVSILAVVDSYSGPTQSRALDLDIIIRADATHDAIKLTTGVYRFSTKGAKSSAVVDLFSMVHIADNSFFESIKEAMKEYDVVLYELITDNKNCDSVEGSNFKRQLNTEISAAETEKLASQYQLESQVSLYNSIRKTGSSNINSKWFIADLDSAEVMRLETPRKHITLASFRASRSAGRAWGEQLMKKFFLSDTGLITALRYMSWLGPCPEFSCLLLDWSRWNQPTKAGGLPAALLPIIEHISRGNISAAKKLAFAQQLISGVPDSGAWGGAALSDTEVRVKARNSECCRVLKGFLDEHEQIVKDRPASLPRKDLERHDRKREHDSSSQIKNDDEIKVAILYGAYHVGDLSTKLKAMGLRSECTSSLTAWSMESPSKADPSFSPLQNHKSTLKDGMMKVAIKDVYGVPSITEVLSRVKQPALSVAVASMCSAYLVVGALDWWLLIDLLVQVAQNISDSAFSSHKGNSVVTALLLQLVSGDLGAPVTDDGKVLEVSLTVLYIVAYAQRHLWALRTASSVGVQWDRGLFDDSLDT